MGTNSLLLCVFVLVASSSAFTVLSLGDNGTASVLPCLSELMPCTPYLHAEKPPAVCCMPLKIALDTEAPCLCKLFDDQALLGTFNVTQSDMLHFPKKCGHAPPNLSLCKNSAGTVPPPPPGAPSTKPPPASPNGPSSSSESLRESMQIVAAFVFGGVVSVTLLQI
uniref:Bifunctional inhibitor/plant lipid transfer protein/seed storage helical domain-containing protein n=1 Tax=Ananas comosus var. bracteatus TaxID=296719 RepID=A0A6V7P6U5_ANACO|nr:unnamed protein product [Ananas comosus var. bracteatus]